MPGVLVFNLSGGLVYISAVAREIFSATRRSTNPAMENPRVPAKIASLCKRVARTSAHAEEDPGDLCETFSRKGVKYVVRAIPLFKAGSSGEPALVMAAVEKCSLGRKIEVDVKRVREKFGLTGRESQVVSEVLKGRTNQDIAGALSITENTVKDHVKKIMVKLEVPNRASIICRILQ